jgi:hypothetical protein
MHMDREEWIMYGWKHGYCSAPHCATHDGLFMTLTEEELFDDGSDPCVHMVRLYEDGIELEEVESNNAAAHWRASNRGWQKDA